MSDYITCVEASGGNKQTISSEVSNAQSGKFKAGAKGAGSGVVVKGSGSLVIDKDAEQALAQKFETTLVLRGHARMQTGTVFMPAQRLLM